MINTLPNSFACIHARHVFYSLFIIISIEYHVITACLTIG